MLLSLTLNNKSMCNVYDNRCQYMIIAYNSRGVRLFPFR